MFAKNNILKSVKERDLFKNYNVLNVHYIYATIHTVIPMTAYLPK